MSSTYRMNVVWSSQGAQLQRDINTFLGQMGQMENRVARNQRQMGLWGQQMRAIGTTIRYALAGSVVFSVATAINSLGDFEARLGEIDSLAARMDSSGRLIGLGDNLRTVGDIALETSQRIGVSADQIQQHMIGFYSAFNAPAGQRGIEQMTEFTNAMADLTLVSEGADPQQLARAVAAMARDVRTGQLRPGRTGDVGDLIAEILRTTPNIRGEDIARDLGRLSAARVASRMTPEEILGVYGQAAKAGGSAAVIGRGVSQLLTTGIVSPRTKAEQEAFQRAVGTADPTALRELGGIEILRRMMRAVSPRGARVPAGAARILGSEDFTDEEALRAAGGQLKGINLTLATQLFGRQESLRVFLNLLSQGGPQAMQDYIDSLKQGQRQNVLRQRADLVNNQRFWQRMQAEQQAIGISLVRAIEPAFRVLEHRVIRPVAEFTTRHPRTALGIAAGVGAAGLAVRLGAAGGLRGGLRGLLSRGGSLAAAAGPAAAVGAGVGGFNVTGMPTGVPGVAGAGSRTNPFWVIVDPMSWFLPGAPSGMGGGGPGAPGGGGRGVTGFLRRQLGRAGAAIGGAAGAAAGRAGLFGRIGLVGGATAALAAADIAAILATPGASGDNTNALGSITPAMRRRYPFVSRLVNNLDRRDFSRGTREQLNRFATGDISAAHFERWLRMMALRNAQGRGDVQVDGEAALAINVELNEDARRLLRISSPEGIPVKLWSQGAPQHRGKNKSTRRTGPRGPQAGTGPR